MKKSRFTEHKIVAILSEAESGLPVKDVCRKHDISSAAYSRCLVANASRLRPPRVRTNSGRPTSWLIVCTAASTSGVQRAQ